MKRITIFEFLKKLETSSGDEVLELISLFQCGGIEFADLDYVVNDDN